MHTVTAFIYAGTPGRGFWMTAIMAPPFPGHGLCGRSGPVDHTLHTAQGRHPATMSGKRPYRSWSPSCSTPLSSTPSSWGWNTTRRFTPMCLRTPRLFATSFSASDGNNALAPWYWAMNLAISGRYRSPGDSWLQEKQAPAAGRLHRRSGGSMDRQGFCACASRLYSQCVRKNYRIPAFRGGIALSAGIYCLGILIISALYKVTVSVYSASFGGGTFPDDTDSREGAIMTGCPNNRLTGDVAP